MFLGAMNVECDSKEFQFLG